MDIVCLGELLIDMFPAEVGRRLADVSMFRPVPGGAPANVVVAAARLGLRSAFIGKVGDDAFGYHLADVLAREGVDIRGIRFDSYARTPLNFIAQRDEHNAEYLFYRHPGADMLLRADELDGELLQSTRAFHFGSISLIAEPSRSATLEAIRIACRGGALISFDVNYRPSLWTSADEARDRIMAAIQHVNILKVNEEELDLLCGDGDMATASRALLQLGPDLCVVTLGPNGSFFQTIEDGGLEPGLKVPTVDATGCGDAFVAGLLRQMLLVEHWRDQLVPARMHQILQYANAVAALTARVQGVFSALPMAVEVEKFLKTF